MIPFGPEHHGATLLIDCATIFELEKPIVLDVETDEKDNFVGIGMTQDGQVIHYHTELTDVLKMTLSAHWIVGHNIKFDIKMLRKWGVDVKCTQLKFDTALASYVQNTTRSTHSLKDLAKEILGLEWPTYKEMVGSGKAKITLDKQEVGRVAAYCGMDVLGTYRLWQHFEKVLSPQQKNYLRTIELPTARVLLEMEIGGVRVDLDELKHLKGVFGEYLKDLTEGIKKQWNRYHWSQKEPLNINSNRQIALLLECEGAVLPRTPKGNKKVDKATLNQLKHIPVVPLLLEHSKIEKLMSTYVLPLLDINDKEIVYASFNQISKGKGEAGISSGRLSSSNPNLQNIPTKTSEGNLLRGCFIPRDGRVFIGADYSQIEPRLVAHVTQDKTFMDAYLNGRDIYQELVEGTGRSRNDGKTFMLALLYGAQPKKLASVFGCGELEAEEIVERIMRKLPSVTAWIERTKFEARQKRGVYTLFKRWIPLPGIDSSDRYEKMHWERAAVNYKIQGSAAEIMKLALCKLQEEGYIPVLTVHDEVLIEVPDDANASTNAAQVRRIMENVVSLSVPLSVTPKIGKNWKEVK
jgi:DNA polymerase-1